MQYFVIFTPKEKFKVEGMPPDFLQLLLKEEARARDLYAQGTLRQSWVLGSKDNGAAVLCEVESAEHLQDLIDSFPLVKADISDIQVVPLAPDPAFANQS